MSAPNGTAFVPIDQRARLTYKITLTAAAPVERAVGAANRITEIWRGNRQAVVISAAAAPRRGGTNLVGRTEWFTSLDIKTAHQLPSVTWDAYLDPYRDPFGWAREFFAETWAELVNVELLTPQQAAGSSAPGTRSTSLGNAAGSSQAAAVNMRQLLATASSRVLVLLVLALLVVLAVQFGPKLAGKLKLAPT